MVPGAAMSVDTAAGQRDVRLVRQRPPLARQAASATVEFGKTLRRHCAEPAGAFTSASGIALSCAAERADIPAAAGTDLELIARGPIASASNSFASRRHGRIGVSFRVDAAELQLRVEHSGPGTPAALIQADEGAKLWQMLVARFVVTVPRP